MQNEEEVRRVARIAAQEAVKETLIVLGVDAANPLEMQRDFQHLRAWRLGSELVKRRALISIVTVFITGTLSALWLVFRPPH